MYNVVCLCIHICVGLYEYIILCVNWYSLTAVVPLHTQRLAAVGRLQQLELQQDGLV